MLTRQMKDSGVMWIGEIPNNWNIFKLGNLAIIRTGNTPADKEKSIFTESNGMDWIKTDNLLGANGISRSKEKLASNILGKARIAKPFSCLVCCIGDIGKIGFNQYEVAYNQQINSVYFDENVVYWKFGMYALLAQKQQHEYYSNGNVLKILNTENQKKIKIAIPDKLIIQKNIVKKLDLIVSSIDKIIFETQQSIEELKKYKQSLITEVVIKGLDKSVEMKDSGIDWIGKIPHDWEVINSKRLFGERKEKAYVTDIQLTASQKHGILSQEEFMKLENQRVTVVEFNKDILKHVEPGDFVISMRSFQGGLEYSEVRGCISSAYVMLYPKMKIHTGYFKWLFKSMGYISALQSTSNLIRDGQALRYANFSKVPLLNIPYSQQDEISSFLNQKVASINKLIDEKELLISEFEQYKKSLIYEYVTGKKQV